MCACLNVCIRVSIICMLCVCVCVCVYVRAHVIVLYCKRVFVYACVYVYWISVFLSQYVCCAYTCECLCGDCVYKSACVWLWVNVWLYVSWCRPMCVCERVCECMQVSSLANNAKLWTISNVVINLDSIFTIRGAI